MGEKSGPYEMKETLAAQLKAAAVQHRDAQEVAERKAKAFRRLVVECVDAGVRIKDVAAVAGVRPSRVHAIVAYEDSRP